MSKFQRIAKEEYARLDLLLRQKKRLLNLLPKGSLSVRKRGEYAYLYWTRYVSIDGKKRKIQTMLHEKDRHLVQQLRQRKQLQRQIRLMEGNLAALDIFLKQYRPCGDTDIYKGLPPAYQSCFEYRGFKSEPLLTTVPPNAFHPEHLVHKNSVGELFRSKGEVQVSEFLRNRKIPYTYEPVLEIGGQRIIPDFSFQLPGTNRIIYVELFAMLDNDEYFHQTIKKMQLFLNNGYVSGRDVLFLLESYRSGSDLETLIRQLDSFISQ